MKRLLILLLFIFVILLSACVDRGIVIDKSFQPSHMVYSPMIMVVGKQTRIIPRWFKCADTWSILVQNDNEREWWKVSKEYYDSVSIGNYVRKEGAE